MDTLETGLRRSLDAEGAEQEVNVSVMERRLRAILLGILVLAMVGTGVELLLLEHTETIWQLIPLLGLTAGLISASAVAVRRSRPAVRILQGLMVLFLMAGGLGIFLHYKGNTEFEKEMYPSMEGFELFRESMMGATPALAPGTMAWLGLLGLAYTYRHPQLRDARRDGRTKGGST